MSDVMRQSGSLLTLDPLDVEDDDDENRPIFRGNRNYNNPLAPLGDRLGDAMKGVSIAVKDLIPKEEAEKTRTRAHVTVTPRDEESPPFAPGGNSTANPRHASNGNSTAEPYPETTSTKGELSLDEVMAQLISMGFDSVVVSGLLRSVWPISLHDATTVLLETPEAAGADAELVEGLEEASLTAAASAAPRAQKPPSSRASGDERGYMTVEELGPAPSQPPPAPPPPAPAEELAPQHAPPPLTAPTPRAMAPTPNPAPATHAAPVSAPVGSFVNAPTPATAAAPASMGDSELLLSSLAPPTPTPSICAPVDAPSPQTATLPAGAAPLTGALFGGVGSTAHGGPIRAHGASLSAPPQPLPPGWHACFDGRVGLPYWYCEATGYSQWEPPSAVLTVHPLAPRNGAAAILPLPPGWHALNDVVGRPYWFNTATQTSQWEPPRASLH